MRILYMVAEPQRVPANNIESAFEKKNMPYAIMKCYCVSFFVNPYFQPALNFCVEKHTSTYSANTRIKSQERYFNNVIFFNKLTLKKKDVQEPVTSTSTAVPTLQHLRSSSL